MVMDLTDDQTPGERVTVEGGCREDRNGDNLEDGRPVIVLIED